MLTAHNDILSHMAKLKNMLLWLQTLLIIIFLNVISTAFLSVREINDVHNSENLFTVCGNTKRYVIQS